ncbi:hypothetical protein D9M73_263210 [compost metagenome]
MPLAPSSFTTRSAPCLVRVKTSARSTFSSRSRIVSSACFSPWLRKVTNWSTRSAVLEVGATFTVLGSLRNWLASSRIAFGIVAEKNKVWRCLGSIRTILRSA